MMIDKVRRTLPHSLRYRLKRTHIGQIYYSEPVQRYRGKYTRLETLSFCSDYGDFTLEVPKSAGLISERSPCLYEPGLVDRLIELLDSESHFLDVGAGYGYNCKLALLAGVPPNQIVLVEASPFRSEILKRNVPKEVEVIEAFIDSGSEDGACLNEIFENRILPNVVTIDIEGQEFEAVKGATSLLESETTFLIELHPEKLQGGKHWTELQDFLQTHGYDLQIQNHRENSQWKSLNNDLVMDNSTDSPTALVEAT
ncbi:hypothetical protein [Natronomonas marina]|uniref:hypothetical protein n=1 Tax=Natronomonas marina TaxID=2961939 RepID=UPI0020CA0F52|nr:hypothetical protein [Natronomonas marina]